MAKNTKNKWNDEETFDRNLEKRTDKKRQMGNSNKRNDNKRRDYSEQYS